MSASRGNGSPIKAPSKPLRSQEQEQEQEQEIGAAPVKPAAPAVIGIPLNDGSDYPITEAQVREFTDLYPAVDVSQALREMRAWCVSNPTHRKTKTGVLRFVNRWLAKEQDQARPGGNTPQKTTVNHGDSPAAARPL